MKLHYVPRTRANRAPTQRFRAIDTFAEHSRGRHIHADRQDQGNSQCEGKDRRFAICGWQGFPVGPIRSCGCKAS